MSTKRIGRITLAERRLRFSSVPQRRITKRATGTSRSEELQVKVFDTTIAIMENLAIITIAIMGDLTITNDTSPEAGLNGHTPRFGRVRSYLPPGVRVRDAICEVKRVLRLKVDAQPRKLELCALLFGRTLQPLHQPLFGTGVVARDLRNRFKPIKPQ